MTDTETWKHELDRAAGLIAAVELDHPGNKKLARIAAPFLDYVNGLGNDTQEEGEES